MLSCLWLLILNLSAGALSPPQFAHVSVVYCFSIPAIESTSVVAVLSNLSLPLLSFHDTLWDRRPASLSRSARDMLSPLSLSSASPMGRLEDSSPKHCCQVIEHENLALLGPLREPRCRFPLGAADRLALPDVVLAMVAINSAIVISTRSLIRKNSA